MGASPKFYDVDDALLGGPGLDGYAYRAAVYCVPCGQRIAREVFQTAPRVDWATFNDSEQVPQPIFFGESDCAEHCDECGAYLYGPEEPQEPGEDDLTTSDHIHVYQYGKLVLETMPETFEADVQAFMDREQFWPNVWFISDHGNAHLLTLGEVR